MEIKAFKSEFTGELFESEKDYLDHLNEIEKQNQERKRAAEIESKKDFILNEPRLTATSIEDFRQKAFDAISILNEGNPDKLLLLDFSGVRFGDVSNTHSSPIDGVSNFSQKDDKPKHYKGWNGEITIVFSDDRNTGKNRDRVENLIKYFPGINTGSGSYRGKTFLGVEGYVLQYSLRLYLDDFPLIKEKYEQYETFLAEKKKWQQIVNSNVDEKNDSDERLTELKRNLADFREELRGLTVKINDTVREIDDVVKANKEAVLSSVPFPHADVIEEYHKLFDERWH